MTTTNSNALPAEPVRKESPDGEVQHQVGLGLTVDGHKPLQTGVLGLTVDAVNVSH